MTRRFKVLSLCQSVPNRSVADSMTTAIGVMRAQSGLCPMLSSLAMFILRNLRDIRMLPVASVGNLAESQGRRRAGGRAAHPLQRLQTFSIGLDWKEGLNASDPELSDALTPYTDMSSDTRPALT